MNPTAYITNAESKYIEQLYQTYKQDSYAVDSSWQKFFEGFDFAKIENNAQNMVILDNHTVFEKELQVQNLIHAYRDKGHLQANTNPIQPAKVDNTSLMMDRFGLTEEDLCIEFEAGKALWLGKSALKHIINTLEKIYCGNVGFEYTYIQDTKLHDWLQQKIEHTFLSYSTSIKEKQRILSQLTKAAVFENFLQLKYIGQNRFSLEGGEALIPALGTVIEKSAALGVQEIAIGMAHRGRLNVLANIMGKTYQSIFDEFEGKLPLTEKKENNGDVKYHEGYASETVAASGKKIKLKLAPNPSHLEAVNAVIEGFVKASIENQYNNDYNKVIPVLIHGDAALSGQGISYELTQMANLQAYHTGGTVHLVINNQIGFTTNVQDARSSTYCTDLAKLIDAPVMHVNGDDPEAVTFCVALAIEFRQQFHKDIFIDLVCYRKHGHNEGDEPKFTQPDLYKLIDKHPNPSEIYKQKLIHNSDIDTKQAKKIEDDFKNLLQAHLNTVKQKQAIRHPQPRITQAWKNLRYATAKDFEQSPETGVSAQVIEKVGKSLVTLPPGFQPLQKIEKLIKQRAALFFKEKKLNWASAELLAYGSLLLEKHPVRLAGQDTQRGTFAHRHAVLHDAKTNKPYYSLDHMAKNQALCTIYNTLLSENAALGFELGYAMAEPNTLTLWEAQFGDFANGAQIIIDQFISAAETKWQQMNGLVLLLPHGYEGQGPEHSSARLERFLQLAASYNMQITNITTAANFFHALRRQLAWPFRKPLVVMSPKSLLRHPKVMSPIKDFTQGHFQEVMDDTFVDKRIVKQILFCAGKVYYELHQKQQADQRKDIAIVRLEQLYPFPEKQLQELLATYPKKTKYIWVQEEPANMGAWPFLSNAFNQGKLHCIARKASASPATGYRKVYMQEQQVIIQEALA